MNTKNLFTTLQNLSALVSITEGRIMEKILKDIPYYLKAKALFLHFFCGKLLFLIYQSSLIQFCYSLYKIRLVIDTILSFIPISLLLAFNILKPIFSRRIFHFKVGQSVTRHATGALSSLDLAAIIS